MTRYRVVTQTLAATDPRLGEVLAGVYANRERPLCLCQGAGVPMYIARFEGRFLIKRMPNSGAEHAPSCDSYEPPAELSGLGEVLGAAIRENPDDGTTALRLDFALSKVPGRAPPISGEEARTPVRSDGSRLTLRSLLHFLWDQAGFNRWFPAMAGKRRWPVLRRYLQLAASDKIVKGRPLSERLYVPEPFTAEHKAAIRQRREARLADLAAATGATRPLMIVVGEVKAIETARYGHKMLLRHAPDFPFMLDADLHRRLARRCQAELGLWDGCEDGHLMMIGTFGLTPGGIATLEEVALMNVNAQWIPFENAYDKPVIDQLYAGGRRFQRGLRYNLPATRPLAFAVLSDTLPVPTALYLEPPASDEGFRVALDALIADSPLASWRWRCGAEPMPALPLRGHAATKTSDDAATNGAADSSRRSGST
jgi:hypothetical protein